MEWTDQSLTTHHRQLEDRFQALMGLVAKVDVISLRCEWLLFERELDERMRLEERELMPQLMRVDPIEAAAIRGQHQRIRTMLADLAIAVDLHTLRVEAVVEFMQLLRAHAEREEQLFARKSPHTPRTPALN